MPRPKKRLSLQDHLSNYENKVLIKAAEEMEHSLFWPIFASFLRLKQREYEVAALDMVCHSSTQVEASKASGLALAHAEIADKYMENFRELLKGATGVYEDQRPQDEE